MTASPGAPQTIKGEADSFLAFDLDDFGIMDENLNRPIAESGERGLDGLLYFCDALLFEGFSVVHGVGLSNHKEL